jgi:hypothetical protein
MRSFVEPRMIAGVLLPKRRIRAWSQSREHHKITTGASWKQKDLRKILVISVDYRRSELSADYTESKNTLNVPTDMKLPP